MNISIVNGRTFIDGKEYIQVDAGRNKVTLKVNGEVVGEYKDKIFIEISGDVQCVDGVNFTVVGNVSGDVDGTNIRCGNVGGNVDGTNITCGDIKGKVDAVNVSRR